MGVIEIDLIILKDKSGAILTINERVLGIAKIRKRNEKGAHELAIKKIKILQ